MYSFPMRICVVGAGAIGGLLGGKLAQSGVEVTFIARGATLAAINAGGIRIVYEGGREERSAARATDDYGAAGTFDVVLLTVKAHHLPAIAPSVASLLREDTVVLPMQNGLPYWYFHQHGGALAGRSLAKVDPGAIVMRALDPRRVLGCVVYAASHAIAPGVVAHHGGKRFMIGELDGAQTERLQRVRGMFTNAGLEAPVLADIRAEVWVKLWGNLAFNPISALTGATLAGICGNDEGRELAAQMMREAQQVAERLGITFRVSIERRIEGAARVGHHKTSMLQDVEAGRPLEIDALTGAVVELGEMVGVETPTITAVYRAVRVLDQRICGVAEQPVREALP